MAKSENGKRKEGADTKAAHISSFTLLVSSDYQFYSCQQLRILIHFVLKMTFKMKTIHSDLHLFLILLITIRIEKC